MKWSIFSLTLVLLMHIAMGIWIWLDDNFTAWHREGYIGGTIFMLLMCILMLGYIHFEYRRQYKLVKAVILYGLWYRPLGLDTHAD